MIRNLLAAVLLLLITACATNDVPLRNLSGTVQKESTRPDAQGLLIGIVADSQLQTRGNYNNVFAYRGRFEDAMVAVSIRPPALDWAARSLLRTHLEQLQSRGARVVFYLGDGANNGCFDEFAAGFDTSGERARPNEEGVLAILDEFRRSARIPVYYVLGNHDFLGAGSTSRSRRRTRFCEEQRPGRTNRPLNKFEVIQLTDAFNQRNSHFAGWSYHSSFENGDRTGGACGSIPDFQPRQWGCYLAATVDYRAAGGDIQFLLLDTNDWASVTRSAIGSIDQEGLRGAMSFGSRPPSDTPSQTSWFERHARSFVAMRVALTHYDVPGLRKNVPFLGRISRRSQRFMDIFSRPGQPRRPNQQAAYVISAHTHRAVLDQSNRPFIIRCDDVGDGCGPAQRLSVSELNVGSTTDYSNYATLVRLEPHRDASGSLFYDRLDLDSSMCRAIYADIASHSFPNPVDSTDTGLLALGINVDSRFSYRRFDYTAVQSVWANLESYVQQDRSRANCIGLLAAALEKDRARALRMLN